MASYYGINKRVIDWNLSEFKLFKLYGRFLWAGFTASKLESLRGGSLLFTIQFPEIPGTHVIDLGRMKG